MPPGSPLPNNTGARLSVGKQADLAVLNQPFMTMPEDRIDTIRAVLTLVDGRIVHESPDLNAGQ